MKYRNIKTGAVIDVSNDFKTDLWEPVEILAPISVESEDTNDAPVKKKRVAKKATK